MGETFSVEAILSAVDRGFTSAMRNAKNSVSALGKISSGLKFGALTAAGGKAFSVITDGAKGLVSELNASQATWKTFESNMDNLGKKSDTIKKIKGDLQDFATKSIYSASDMASTYSQLSAVGTKNTTDLVKAFGGLAAAAENPQQAMKTLSQQATQMAAKPTVQWMDFKLMLEQTPAGINEVAKAMGKTTGQLVKDVQDGKVKTEDFFKAMRKAGGEGTALNKMATQYKTMGQAIDGVKESLTTKLQPAFDVVSDCGIKAIGKFEGVLSKIDGDKIAKVLSAGLSKASSVASKVFAKIAPVAASAGKTLYNFGKAVFDVGRNIATNKTFVNGLKTAMSGLSSAVSKVSGYMSKHSSTLGKLAPIVLGAVVGYKGLNKALRVIGKGGAKTATTGFSGISTALNKLNPAGLLSLAGSVGVFVAALGALSAMRGMIIPFLEGLVGVFGQFMGVIRQNTDVILTLVNGALQGLANAFVTMAPAMQPIATALASLSPLIEAIGTAIATVLPALGPVFESIGTAIATVVESVGKAIEGIAGAITPIVEIIAEAIVQIVEAIAPYTPEITKMVEATSQAVQSVAGAFSILVENLSGIFDSIGGVIQTFADGAVNVINAFADGASQVLTTFGDTVSTILTNAGNFFTTFAEAVSTVLTTLSTSVETVLSAISTSFETFGTTVETILNGVSGVVETVGGAISGVLDSVAGIFESMGTAALNAGNGVKALASGVKTLVGLSLADLAATLGAVAAGLGKIATTGAGVSKAGTGIGKMASSAKAAAAGLATLVTSLSKLSTAGKSAGTTFASGLSTGLKTAATNARTAVTAIVKSMTSSAKTAKSAGTAMGTSFSTGLQSSMSRATSVAATMTKTVANKIRSGRSAAHSAGSYVGQGVASGLRSALGSVTSAANAIIAQVNRAMQAKAKIHSPSKLTNEEVGQPLATGVAAGIVEKTGDVVSAGIAMVKQSISQMAHVAAGSYSSTWTEVEKAMSSGMESAQEAALKSGSEALKSQTEKYYGATSTTARVTANANQILANKKTIKAISKTNSKKAAALKKSNEKLTKQNEKLNKALETQQKQAEQLYNQLYAQYEATIKAETDNAVNAIKAQMSAITSKYQAMYDEIINQRSNFESKLKDFGSLFSADTYGYVDFKDWNALIKKSQTLKANLQKLQKAGVSKNFLSEITSMSTSEALTYTNALIKKGTGFIQEQSKGYEALMAQANSISKEVYKPYVDAVDKAYNHDLVNALAGLEQTLNQIGQKAAQALAAGLTQATAGLTQAAQSVGQATQEGYIKGIAISSKKSSKATKKSAGKSTKAAKKKLKVHSPSRVFSWIGQMTGKGFINGLDSMGKRIHSATDSMIRIPSAQIPSLSYAGASLNDNYSYGNAKYEVTVVSEIDGKEFARATVDPMSEELEKKNRNTNRRNGNR